MTAPIGKHTPRLTSVGRLLTRARAKLGLRQDEVAAAVEISRGQYSNLENGNVSIAVSKLWLLCRALRLDPGVLLRAFDSDSRKLKETA